MAEAFRVKFQRITKPKIVPADLKSLSLPLSVEPEEKGLTSTFVPFYLGNSYLQLNPDFGKMYVGETLRGVVSIVNVTNYVMEAANIQVQMITERKEHGDPNSNIKNIEDADHLKNLFQQNIRPQETITFPLEYKVEYPDAFFLCFNIIYKHEVYTQTNQGVRVETVEKTQNKRFKFEAKLPYVLKQRGHRDRKTGKVFVEIGLENNSKNTLFFKEISFLCSEAYNLQPLPSNDDEDYNKLCLNVNEGHHFLFQVVPREGYELKSKDLENIGQLYTEWFNIINEAGKAHSPMINLPIPHHDLSLELMKPIYQLTKEIIEAIEITIKNETNAPIDMIMNLNEKEMTGLKIISLSKSELKLGPKQSETIVLFLLPIRLGIYKFGGVKIYNRLAQKELTFNELPGVVIIGEEDNTKLVESLQKEEYQESLI